MAARHSSLSAARKLAPAATAFCLQLGLCLPAAAVGVTAVTPEIVIDVGSELGLEVGATGRLCQSTQVGDAAVDVCPVAFRVRAASPREARLEITRGSDADVEVGFEVRLDQKLTRGVIVLRSNLIGDQAFVDNRPVGATPQRLSLLPGDYSVRVEKEDHKPWQGRVTAVAGQVVETWARLQPLVPTAASGAPRAPSDPGDDPLTLVGGGAEAMEQGDYEEALRLFQRLVELRPEDPYAQKLLAEAQSRLEQENQEIETASEVAYLQLALERAHLDGEPQQTRFYARRLLELEPGNLPATQVLLEDRRRTTSESQRAADTGDGQRVRGIWSEFEDRWFRDEFVETTLERHLEIARQADRLSTTKASQAAAGEGDEGGVREVWKEYLLRWPKDGLWTEEQKQAGLGHAAGVDRYEAGQSASKLAGEGDVEGVETVWGSHMETWPEDSEARSLRQQHMATAVQVRNVSRREPIEWISIPTGRFRYGCTQEDSDCEDNELTRRLITVEQPFLMAKYETTNAQYARCVADGDCSKPRLDSMFENPSLQDRPVSYVSWFQASDFCAWLGGRLPSGVEWEFAAREFFQKLRKDGKNRIVNVSRHPADWDPTVELQSARYPWAALRPSQANSPSRAKSNYAGLGGPDEYPTLAPVGRFPANSRGLHDMAGNVAEWVTDRQAGPVRSGTDPDKTRVVRGGSYESRPTGVRVSAKQQVDATTQSRGVGFRCVVSTEPLIEEV